jgi:hypothetical protein
MSISRNMTEKHLADVMAALPDKMDEGELCALTLTVYSAYVNDPADVISSLIAAVYTYGKVKGFSMDTISDGLRMSADLHDENPKTKH